MTAIDWCRANEAATLATLIYLFINKAQNDSQGETEADSEGDSQTGDIESHKFAGKCEKQGE